MLLAASHAFAAAGISITTPRRIPQFDSVQQLESATQQLRQESWTRYSSTNLHVRRRGGGRTARDDLDQWLMSAEQCARLEALHSQAMAAQAAHQDARLREVLCQAARIVEEENYRAALLSQYSGYAGVFAVHAQNLEALEARLPGDDAAARRARIAPPLEALAALLAPALTATDQDIAQQDASR